MMRTLITREKAKKKKKHNKAVAKNTRDSTPSPLRKAKREATKHKLREEACLRKQRNMAAGVGASTSAARCSFISLKVDQ